MNGGIEVGVMLVKVLVNMWVIVIVGFVNDVEFVN